MVPGVAQAHHTAVPIVALDYRNRVLPAPAAGGVRASVEDAGRKLRLTVAPGHVAVVLGYTGEPFLRFDGEGVAANGRSETAQGLRLVPGRATSARAADAEWRPLASARGFAWADARAWAPTAALHGRSVVPWSVPVVLDGRRIAVSGELTHVGRPALWPWLVLGAIPLLGAAAAAARRQRLWTGAAALAGLAGLATLAGLGGFATGGLAVSGERWALLAVEVALAVVALGFLTRRPVSLVAVAALAAFSIVQAVSELSIFRHGVVVSGLPAAAARAAAALALGAGLGAGGLVFRAPAPVDRRARRRRRSSHLRVSRKEQA